MNRSLPESTVPLQPNSTAPIRKKKKKKEPTRKFIVGQGNDAVTFNLPISILSASPVLSAPAIQHMKEGITGIMRLPEDDPIIFEMLVNYLSPKRLDPKVKNGMGHPETVAAFLVMADKYQVANLKSILIGCIGKALRKNFLNGIKTLNLIYNHGLDEDTELVPVVIRDVNSAYRFAKIQDIEEVNTWFGMGGINCRLLENYLCATYKRYDTAIEELRAAETSEHLSNLKVEELFPENKSLREEKEELLEKIRKLEFEVEGACEQNTEDESNIYDQEREIVALKARCLSIERKGIMFREQRDKERTAKESVITKLNGMRDLIRDLKAGGVSIEELEDPDEAAVDDWEQGELYEEYKSKRTAPRN